MRNGADAIVGTLADAGVTHCFANPGTSEMHLLAALDREPRIRPVLCLFEGVATGAADGFARIAGRPAMTLLHLGPGYANGAANTHNARRAFSPIVNIVGDHATSHLGCDAPLASDIAALAATSSVAVLTTGDDGDPARATAAALAASLRAPGGPATLIVAADHAWSPLAGTAANPAPRAPAARAIDAAPAAAALARASAPMILLGSHATASEAALAAAGRLAAAGVTVFADTFVARQRRGDGRFEPRRLPYFGEAALATIGRYDVIMLAGTASPVSFFAYPGQPSSLVPAHVAAVELCARDEDVAAWLEALAEAFAPPAPPPPPPSPVPAARPPVPDGALTPATIGASLARHLPTDAIVSDDGVTSSGSAFVATAGAARHDWLSLTGGAIGQGLPLAIGAALARPDARVVALTGDGAAMYTPQALWTMAREALDVTVIVYANAAYRILDIEFARTGAGVPGPGAAGLLDLSRPTIDWCALAQGMGVPAQACESAAGFDVALARAFATPGPMLIEARIA